MGSRRGRLQRALTSSPSRGTATTGAGEGGLRHGRRVLLCEEPQNPEDRADLLLHEYGFIPNPESSVYDLGFGHLLFPINEAINSTLNQLFDAGHLANAGGGFIGSGSR